MAGTLCNKMAPALRKVRVIACLCACAAGFLNIELQYGYRFFACVCVDCICCVAGLRSDAGAALGSVDGVLRERRRLLPLLVLGKRHATAVK